MPRQSEYKDPAVTVDAAVSALARGQMVVVIDDEVRENEGDLVVAADLVTEEQMAFLVSHTTGIVCTPLSEDRADLLALPLMVTRNTDIHGTAFTVSVDHIGTGTGVSARDRTRTARALADPTTIPSDLRRPGHLFPLRARAGGVLVRQGHTEAAVDLLRLAGRPEVAVISEIVDDDGSMRCGRRLREFAEEHGLPVVAVADLVRYRKATERTIERISESALPARAGSFRAVAFRSTIDGLEHLALVLGDVAAAGHSPEGVLVRVHSECLTGDVLGSLRCDCGDQLDGALQAIASEGCGILVYLRGHVGRGIGLAHKISAYALQDDGLDTVDANEVQGLPVDARTYGVGAQILVELGVRRLRLITNNPAKYSGLDGFSLAIVGRVRIPTAVTPHNLRYLRTKRDRMGHDLPSALPAQ